MHRTVRLGAAYYNEYLPDPDRLQLDLSLMKQAGITCIRVGESVWSTWEPRDGEFNLDWLEPILDGAAEHGIDVILGTPSYAIPPWLQTKHPQLAIERVDGNTAQWGARQEVDFTSRAFRRYAERVIRAILTRYSGHKAVVGIQLDNEPGLHLIANREVVARFHASLQQQYGTVEALNEAWGLAYWSHRISHWNELWHPRGNTTPAYDLAWRRFQADLTADFIAWQAEIAREIVSDDRFLTTCIAYNRAAVDDVALGGVLDVVSGNAYLEAQDALAAESPGEHGPDFWYSTSPSGLFVQADRMRSSRESRFLVTETGATSIAGSNLNFPPYDGQLGQIAWSLIARGAELVSYWHWHTLHHGAEQAWGGILGHDLEPGRIYTEISAIGAAITTAGETIEGLTPHEDIGFLFSRESRWAMQFHPPLSVGQSRQPDRWSYDRITARFAEAAFDAKLQLGFISVEQLSSAEELLARFPVLVVAGASVLPDAAAELLCRYAEIGGRLVLGIRSGAGDEIGRARVSALPGPFRRVAGVRIGESSNLRGAHALRAVEAACAASATTLSIGDEAVAEAWADAIELEGAVPLLGYEHPHFARWAAAAENRVGDGTVLTVGTLPDRATLAQLLERAAGGAQRRHSAQLVLNVPSHVSVHGATNASGATVWFLHNWSAERAVVELRMPAADAIATAHPAVGPRVEIEPWGVRVLLQTP